MPIHDEASEFAGALAAPGRLLGLDAGTKTIGVALSDTGRIIATPLKTVARTRLRVDLAELRAIVAEHEIAGLVVGLPRNMDGSEGPRCQSIRALARELDVAFGLPILLWDERLSTAAVERALVREADMSRKRRAANVDKLAAAYILQGALDALGSKARSTR